MENLLEQDVVATIGLQKYFVEVKWRNGLFLMDEPKNINGQDLGPDPYSTLLASLAGCTLSTLRMYIDRKEWNIPEISVSMNLSQTQNPLITNIQREIIFSESIEDDKKQRLLLIAQKCPVSKILENKILINTTI